MILYIGNKLSKYGNTPTSVETLGELLKQDFQMTIISDKKNKIFRLCHMLYSIIKYKDQTSLILIDTYSTANFYYAFFCASLAKHFKIPYIPILRGGNLLNRIDKNPKMSKIIFFNAKINVAPSNYLYASFQKLNFKVTHIPNSIDLCNYVFKDRKNIQPNFLYVRAFAKIYNPQLIIEVMHLLIKEFPNAKLCMVGPDKDGTLQDVQALIKKYNLEKNILITGKLEKSAWIKLSEDYDIFLNPTNFDNTPVSVIEAMALGLPVISTNVGGIPYMLTNNINSLLIPPNNPLEMFTKIKYLLENPNIARQIACEARKKAEQFDWNNIKKDWIKVISINKIHNKESHVN